MAKLHKQFPISANTQFSQTMEKAESHYAYAMLYENWIDWIVKSFIAK